MACQKARTPVPRSTPLQNVGSRFAVRPFQPTVASAVGPPPKEESRAEPRPTFDFTKVPVRSAVPPPLPRGAFSPVLLADRRFSTEGQGSAPAHRASPIQPRLPLGQSPVAPENRTGLPDQLKARIESLSGASLDHVRVHYNSSKPSRLHAHAFAQGHDIHVAPGQEKHLPHETWHVVQQGTGRVKPTLRTKSGIALNDDAGLEKEADVMGERAMDASPLPRPLLPALKLPTGSEAPVQRTVLSKVYDLQSGGTKRVYYSTYDPDTEFDDHIEAWRHDTGLALAASSAPFNPSARYPTNYTYYNTPARNILPLSRQGPHSLSHSALSHRFARRVQDTDLRALRDQQIPSPEEFAKQLEEEAPKGMKRAQKERMQADYQLLYDRLNELLEAGETGPKVHELMMRLMQMNPYSAYGKGKKTGKRNIKGHGERADASFEDSFDSGAKFRSAAGYKVFKRKRRALFSDAEESSSDESEESPAKKKARKKSPTESDGTHESAAAPANDDSVAALSPIEVMIRLGRTHRGALYIMGPDDWVLYEQYKRDHPEYQYDD